MGRCTCLPCLSRLPQSRNRNIDDFGGKNLFQEGKKGNRTDWETKELAQVLSEKSGPSVRYVRSLGTLCSAECLRSHLTRNILLSKRLVAGLCKATNLEGIVQGYYVIKLLARLRESDQKSVKPSRGVNEKDSVRNPRGINQSRSLHRGVMLTLRKLLNYASSVIDFFTHGTSTSPAQ